MSRVQVAPNLYTQIKQLTARVTALGRAVNQITSVGGVLSGTLPNPGFSASALAALGIARGQVVLTWAGNAYSNQLVVNHSLSGVPTYVGVSDTETGGPYLVACEAFRFTSTQFTAQGAFVNGSTWTGSKTFCWIAYL